MDLCRPEEPAGRTLNTLVARWHVTGAAGSPGTAHHPATSLELFHTFALIRDEVMDRSATRCSRPTAHRVQAGRYHGQRPPGTPAGYPATQAATSPAPSHASPDAGHRTDRDRLPDREIHRRTPPSHRGRPRQCRPAAAGCASGVCAFAGTPGMGAPARAYVQSLGHVIRGNIDWALNVPRYTVDGTTAGDTVIWTEYPADSCPSAPPLPSIAWWWDRDL
jgi:hypothetical protein